MDRPYGMLFISRRNSARSLMAEAVVNRLGRGRFRAYSAAVEPAAVADPWRARYCKKRATKRMACGPNTGAISQGLKPPSWTLCSRFPIRPLAKCSLIGPANLSHPIGTTPTRWR